MKKVIYSLLLPVLAMLSLSANGQTVLKGSGLSGVEQLIVIDYAKNAPVDTIVVNDGSFTYTYDAEDGAKLFVLIDQATRSQRLFITENAELTLEEGKAFITGSPLNERLADFFGGLEGIGGDLKAKLDAIRQAGGQQPTDEQRDEYMKIYDELKVLNAAYIKEYYAADKENILGAFELSYMKNFISDDEFAELYNQGGDVIKNFPPFLADIEKKAMQAKTGVGVKYTDFEGVNPLDADQKIKLSDIAEKDNYVLLDFWASWCGPCKAAMPALKEMHEKYGDKGLSIVGVVVWDKLPDHLKTAESLGVTWTQIFDPNRDVIAKTYAIDGVPTLMLLDKDGTILLRTHSKDEVKNKVAELLGE